MGLEPTHLTALDPKSNASTNSATTAATLVGAKVGRIFEITSSTYRAAGEYTATEPSTYGVNEVINICMREYLDSSLWTYLFGMRERIHRITCV